MGREGQVTDHGQSTRQAWFKMKVWQAPERHRKHVHKLDWHAMFTTIGWGILRSHGYTGLTFKLYMESEDANK